MSRVLWPSRRCEWARSPVSLAVLALMSRNWKFTPAALRALLNRVRSAPFDSGLPLSSFHQQKTAVETPPLISLEPADRAWLHQRIEDRFAQMLDAGLVDEVQGLMQRGDLHADLPSMRCVGYRQTWEALEADDLFDLPERGIAATRQLAKRQLTWLRSMPQRHVVACDADDAQARVVALALQLAETLPAPSTPA